MRVDEPNEKYRVILERYMKEKYLSCNDVARSFHVSRQTIHNWVTGKHPIPGMAREIIMNIVR